MLQQHAVSAGCCWVAAVCSQWTAAMSAMVAVAQAAAPLGQLVP